MLDGGRTIFKRYIIDGNILIAGSIELPLVEYDSSPSVNGPTEKDWMQCCDKIRETFELRFALGLRWL